MENDIKKLSGSLIYKMSQGSKELYHSNIWSWLIEQDAEFINAFIDDIDKELIFKYVAREEGNRDITIWFQYPNQIWKCYVIENKLKSIPYYEQLEKYTNELGDYFTSGILTGLRKPNIADENGYININGKKWKFVSYSEISLKIKEIVEKSNVETIITNKNIIVEYLSNNECIDRIVNKNIVKNNLKQVDDSKLNKLGLSDLINKIIGSSLVSYVKNKLKEDKIDIPFFYISEGFHNKKITLDFKISNWQESIEKNIPYLNIGIQIEGYQYRRMVDLKKDGYNAERIFEEFSNQGYFDINYDGKEKVIRFPNDGGMERSTKQDKKYCKYGETIVYQYSYLEGNSLNFENIYQNIKKDILFAYKIMTNTNE